MLLSPRHAVTTQLIEAGYCIVGDEVYAAREVMAVPWAEAGGSDRWRDSYSCYQSSCPVHIEQVFCTLVWRWGVFWRPLRVPFFKRPSLVQACFKLHSFFPRYSCSAEELAPFERDSVGGSVFFRDNDFPHPGQRGRRRNLERSRLKTRMTERVRELVVLRPGVAPMH